MTEPSDDTVRVVVDVNEPDDVWPLVARHPDVDEWQEVDLATADLVVNGIGFERKTPMDFAESVMDRRLKEQAPRLAADYDHAYVLLEETFESFSALPHTDFSPNAARGAAARITASYIPVVTVGGSCDDGTATALLVDYAIRLGRKLTVDAESSTLPTGPVDATEPPGKRMWACLPGIGPALADRLYDRFGPPTQVTNRNDPDEAMLALEGVDGIGEVTAERIRDVLWGTP